jgi:hypothetical protein
MTVTNFGSGLGTKIGFGEWPAVLTTRELDTFVSLMVEIQLYLKGEA